MFIEERHGKILEKIKKNGRISVQEIQDEFNVSLDSARRDLRILEQKNLVKRTHGGAISIQKVDIRPDKKRSIKTSIENLEVYENYVQIAKHAATYIEQGDVVYLTNSSLGFLMLKNLPRNFEYTLVVNSATLADELKYWDNITVYLVGGKMRMNSSTSIVDSLATAFVKNMRFDKAFITGNGISSDFGLSIGTDETAVFQRMVINNSNKSFILAPSQKVGQNAFIKVCDIDVFSTMITDPDCSDDEIKNICEKGVEVIVAKV